MDPNQLLDVLATDLWHEANRWVPSVFRGETGVPNGLRQLIAEQDAPSLAAFQLPDPVSGPMIRPDVLVLGLNPGHDPEGDNPRLGSGLQEYAEWYRHRFGPKGRDTLGRPIRFRLGSNKPRVIPHYSKVESMLAPVLGGSAFGRQAVYADAIPWISKRGPRMTPEVKSIAHRRITQLVNGLDPRVVITLGRDITSLLLPRQGQGPTTVALRIGAWEGWGIGVLHPAARRPQGYSTKVAEALSALLRPENPWYQP